ncbi:MAG: PQQ-dependent sugar dehydrogenase [Actinomycetota bacterium]
MRLRAPVAAGAAVLALAAAVIAGTTAPGASWVVVPDAAFPAAMAALPAGAGGGFVYGERLTGRVMQVSGVTPDAPSSVTVFDRVDVSIEGEQRGLLGLAADGSRIYAAWTEPTGRIVVGRLEGDGDPTLIWRGPASTDRANGGHLEFAPDGSLVIGVGSLLDDVAARDPDTVNGKLLALDPDGPADQAPSVISGGWNNPFAFGYAPDGTLYVADNSGGDAPERLAIGNAGPSPEVLATWSAHTVASGLTVLDDAHLLVCTYLTRRLIPFTISGSGAMPGLARATDCSIGVIQLADGTLVYANETELRGLSGD